MATSQHCYNTPSATAKINCLKHSKIHCYHVHHLYPQPKLDPFLPSQSHFSRLKGGGSGKTLFTHSSKTEYGDSMTDIMPHKHCMVCGNAVRPDENFCDELCESKFKSAQRKQQLLFLAFLAIMGLVLFLPSILKMYG